VNADLLQGLARLGHRIECFLPSAGHPLPANLVEEKNLEFIWGTSGWRWDRWYSRTKITAFASGMLSRTVASLRLRRTIARRHRSQPYDLVYQFSSIETPALPYRLRRAVPLVIHPETHSAGELRSLLAERRLSLRCQPWYIFAAVVALMSLRSLIQRVSIRHAHLLVCISSVFRDHLVRDYGFPQEATVVIPNPVRIDRFAPTTRQIGNPPTVLVLGRVATRKGIEDVVAVARALLTRGANVRLDVVGGPSLWSDYSKLLDDLPPENATYAGAVSASEVPARLLECDVLLQASKYEPFALTVAEALAAGALVVATSEVGAIEDVDRSVVAEVQPGDVEAMVAGISTLLSRLEANPAEMRSTARAEAQRLFAPDVVCQQISVALAHMMEGRTPSAPTSVDRHEPAIPLQPR
jgi:glycosyltransferase involved in cell wall biosynthesis